MPISPEDRQQQLERLIQKTARNLPPRRAPGTLENRVLAEIERRAVQPWWRKSYAHWPLPARCLFLIGSGGLMKAAIMVTIWFLVGFESAPFVGAFAVPYAWLHSLAALGSSLWDFAGAVLYSIPRFWLYGAVISLAVMYATVVGLCVSLTAPFTRTVIPFKMKLSFQHFWRGTALALFFSLALTAPAQEPAANADEKKPAAPPAQKSSPAASVDDAPAPDAPPDEVLRQAEAAKLEAGVQRDAADELKRRAQELEDEMRAKAQREMDAAKSRAEAIRDRADDIKRRAEEMKARTRARVDEERSRRREMQARRTGDDVVNIFENSFLPAGEKADNVVSVFGNATSEGEVVESVVSVFGNSQVKGRTGDAVVAIFGNVSVDARVGTVVAIFGNVNLGPKAEVDEEVVCVMGHVNKNSSAVVHHQVKSIGPGIALGQGLQTWIQECLKKGRPLAFNLELGWAWGIAFALLAFYAVLALIFRGGIENCTRTLETRPGASLLTAICTVFLSPIVIVFLCVIVIGLIVVPFLSMGLLFASLFGKAVMLAWIGRRCTRTLGDGPIAHPAVGVLIGGSLMLILYTVPFFGFLIFKLIGWMGLGVVVLTVLTGFRRERPAKPFVVPAAVGAVASAGAMGALAAPLTGEPTAATGVPIVPPVIAAITLARAGFWIRLAALGIDVVLVWILTHTLTGILPGFGSIHIKADFFPSLALYATLMWKLRGTTIGGIVCNLKVVRIDGREIDWGTAIVRALGCFLSLAIAGLGFIWVAIDDDRQSWHDKIAGTTVVHMPKGVSLL